MLRAQNGLEHQEGEAAGLVFERGRRADGAFRRTRVSPRRDTGDAGVPLPMVSAGELQRMGLPFRVYAAGLWGG